MLLINIPSHKVTKVLHGNNVHVSHVEHVDNVTVDLSYGRMLVKQFQLSLLGFLENLAKEFNLLFNNIADRTVFAFTPLLVLYSRLE